MRRSAILIAVVAAGLAGSALPAAADHTDPNAELSPVIPHLPAELAITSGEGEWEHLANVGPMQGTDLEPFTKNGITYVSGGTLGQAQAGTPGFVGQRILQLTDASGAVLDQPEIVADHGSASCTINTSATGLQHDVQAVPFVETQVLVDTTDATGRCHDTPGGGLEIIDVSGLGEEGFEVRELGLIRLNGLSHTVTADATRPGILYNNGSDFASGTASMTWMDVVDIRSCFGFADGTSLEAKRAACQPMVYRIPWEKEWSSKALPDGTLTEPANCHDTTAKPGRLYCAGLNATLMFDVSNLLDGPNGAVRGAPLPCQRIAGTATGAPVTDCAVKPATSTAANPTTADSEAAYNALNPRPQADGWEFLGSINHPGRACPDPGTTNCNTNLAVPASEGVAVSHESDPTPDGRFLFVTDERGGGVVPPGATCVPGLDNPFGNGGIHAFDITDPSTPKYALTPEGEKAVYIGGSPTPSATFCTVHVIEQVPGEQRLAVAYYDGGTKIVDYAVGDDGSFSWKEVAAFRLPGANTWASEVFRTQDNADGTRTYWFVSTSFALGSGLARGFDVFTWTGAPNPIGAAPATQPPPPAPADRIAAPVERSLPATGADRALLLLAAVLLPVAFGVRVMRRRLTPTG